MIRRRVAAAAAAVVAVVLPGTTAAPGRAQEQGLEGAVLRLASQTPWLQPGGEFGLRVQVAGVPDPDAVEVRVSVHRRITSRSQFALTLDGEQLGGVVRPPITARLSELPRDAGGAIQYRLTPDDLDLTTTGVHPVQVVLRERGGEVLDRLVTHLVFVARPPDGPRLGVSWILPAHAPPAGDPDGLSTLADVLQSPSYRSVPLVVAPTPETIAALSASRSAAARATLDAMRRAFAGRQVLARTWVPVDVRAMVEAELGGELTAQSRRGRDVVAGELGVDPGGDTWWADEPLDDDAVQRLRDLQVDRLVVGERDLEPLSLALTLAQPFKVDVGTPRPVDAAVADAGLSAHFHNRGDQVLAAHQLLADLAVLYLDAPQRERAVVLATPRAWRPSRAFLDAALQGLSSSPLHAGMTLDDLFDDVAPATARRGAPLVRELAPSTRTPVLPALRIERDRARIDGLGSALPVDSEAYDALDRDLLTAQSADLTSRGRVQRLEALERGVDQRVGAVLVPRSRTLTLTAREGEVPLTFQNRSDETLDVLLRLESDRLEFPDGTELRVTLPPENTTLRVRVRARTSGAFPLRVGLATPQGGVELASTRFTVRSTAASGVGVGLSAGAGAFLLVWWLRHLVRGRRARKLVPA